MEYMCCLNLSLMVYFSCLRVIIEKYYTKLTLDFDTNKRIIEEVALIPTKPLRNKIAGFITHLVSKPFAQFLKKLRIKAHFVTFYYR
jgi:ribosomal protein S17E